MYGEPVERFVLVGACIVDNILSVPWYPDEDEKLRCESFTRRRGGNTCNSAEVLQQLLAASAEAADIELLLINVLPAKSCAATKFIADSLGPKVDLSYCIHRESYTEAVSCYIISSKSQDSRTIITHNDLPEMTLPEFKAVADQILAHGKKTHFHFEGRNVPVTLECMKYLQSHPGKEATHDISLEVEKPGRTGLQELAGHADVVFFSRAWADHAGYASAEACLTDQARKLQNCKLLVCTWGAEGSWGCFEHLESGTGRRVRETRHAESSKVKVVDPVGAGDTFLAAMLYALYAPSWLLKLEVEEKMDFANNYAALKIAQEGFGNLVPAGGVFGF